MVWSDANDEAVLVVEALGVEGLDTACLQDCPWPWRCAAENGAGKIAERMEEKIVDCGGGLVGKYLLPLAVVRSVSSKSRRSIGNTY